MPTEIRFRLNHLYQGPNAPFLHAADAGLFADNDIEVSFIEGFSSSQVARAIAAGEADAGFGDVSSTFELALRAGSVPVSCLLPVFARSPCCLGYLPQPRPLALGDLGGATLCGPDGDTSARLLPLLLARNGLTDLRYTYLAVPPPERDRLVAARFFGAGCRRCGGRSGRSRSGRRGFNRCRGGGGNHGFFGHGAIGESVRQ